MNVRMVLQRLTPGMEHRGNTDLRAHAASVAAGSSTGLWRMSGHPAVWK
jgi:hypothetical protein